MAIVINFVIDRFCRVDFVCFVYASTVRLQESDYSQLSNYNCTERLVKNKAGHPPIAFEEIVMVMIDD